MKREYNRMMGQIEDLKRDKVIISMVLSKYFGSAQDPFMML